MQASFVAAFTFLPVFFLCLLVCLLVSGSNMAGEAGPEVDAGTAQNKAIAYKISTTAKMNPRKIFSWGKNIR